MQKFKHKEELLAIAYTDKDFPTGISFLTEDTDDIQVGTWNYKQGVGLNAHYHEANARIVRKTREFVYVKKGKIRVNLYTEQGEFVNCFALEQGSFAIMLNGGHGYVMEKDTQAIEVKCGAFNYDDKKRL